MNNLALALIRFYQRYLWFLSPGSVCRFEPRCSEYAYQAIAKYGILRGGLLGLKRIFSCHPLHKPGFDPLT